MAIIRKPLLPFKGRFGPVVFYRLPCGLICRALNPHTRKRILKDPRFAEFRKCSTRMAKASKIGSAVYKALPEDFREFWMYRAFVGEAMKMLKDKGMTGEEVLERLFKTYVEVWYIKTERNQAEQKDSARKAVKIDIRWKQYYEAARFCDFEGAIKVGTFNNRKTGIAAIAAVARRSRRYKLRQPLKDTAAIPYTNSITVISGMIPTLPGYPINPNPLFTYNFCFPSSYNPAHCLYTY